MKSEGVWGAAEEEEEEKFMPSKSSSASPAAAARGGQSGRANAERRRLAAAGAKTASPSPPAHTQRRSPKSKPRGKSPATRRVVEEADESDGGDWTERLAVLERIWRR